MSDSRVDTYAPQNRLIRTTEVRFRAPGEGPRLAGTLYLPEGAEPPLPGLVVAHGAGSRRSRHERFSRTAAAAGFAVLALDLRGHGDSSGQVDADSHLDVVAAADYLRRRPAVDGERICFRGSSMGSYLGLLAAGEAGLCALALLCPATEGVLLAGLENLDKREEEGEVKLTARFDKEGLRAALTRRNVFRLAEHITTPTLIVQARGDTTVPPDESLKLAADLKGPTQVILLPGGDHASAQASPEVDYLVVEWLTRTAGRAPAPSTEPLGKPPASPSRPT
ncbi:MAG: alpha/beta fold hydrolase [Thermoleophilia bacterium]